MHSSLRLFAIVSDVIVMMKGASTVTIIIYIIMVVSSSRECVRADALFAIKSAFL